jgi:amino acid adenylation domain-containing protein
MAVSPDLLDEDASLIELGLDSVNMMRLPALLKKQGCRVQLRDLMSEPTLSAWWALVQERDKPQPLPSTPAGQVDATRTPLTPVQQAYFIGRRDDQPLGGVGCHLYCEFDGQGVDAQQLQRAVLELCERHPMLRAQFSEAGYQSILPISPWRRLEVYELHDVESDTCDAKLAEIRDTLSHRRLEVCRGEVFDIRLSRLPGGRTRIHLNVDLLVADVLSITILLRNLAELYADETAFGSRSDLGFDAYLRRQTAERSAEREDAMRYWRERLPELPAGPSLPLATDPDQVTHPRFSRRQFHLGADELERLTTRARRHKLTLAATLATAFSEVLARWSAEERFLLNVPLFDRNETDPSVSQMVADFTNLVLLEVDFTKATSFIDRARAVQARLHNDIAWAAYSGVDVLRDLMRFGGRRGHGAPVVFACNLGEPLLSPDFERTLGRLSWAISQTPQVWLDHQIYRLQDGLLLNWDAVEALFPAMLLDAMFEAYERLVRWLCNHDWNEPAPLPLPESQTTVRARVNATVAPIDQRLLHDPFLDNAAKTPDATAVLWSSGALSYGALKDRATELAAALHVKGARTGDHIAVVLPKGPDQVAAVLAILMMGGVYVPVAIDSPPERLARILNDAACKIALVSTEFTVEDTWPANVMRVDPAALEVAHDATSGWYGATRRLPTDLAYIIYTSGSTGAPKGVMIDHRGALNTVLDVNRRWSVTAADRVFGLSSLTFDLSVYDLFGAFAAGGTIVLPNEDGRRDPSHWWSLIEQHGVTVWNSVPALMSMMVEFAERRLGQPFPTTLRLALLSGDWIPLSLPDRVRALSPQMQLVGLGGATEASIWSNWFDINKVAPEWLSIPYGYPLTNQHYQVLDGQGRPCPDWVPGDLYIGGIGIAQGYWSDPEKTNKSFVQAQSGERIYRTGDRARYWPDGTLEFLGRQDSQVKIGGHRIELGEIDAAMARVAGVRSATADIQTVDGQQHIVAYLSINSDVPVSPIAFRRLADDSPEERRTAVHSAGMEASSRMPADLDPVLFGEFWDNVESLSVAAIARTLRHAGYFLRTGEVRTAAEILIGMHILPRFHKLVAQWLTVLCEHGVLEPAPGNGYRFIGSAADQDFETRWATLEATKIFGANAQPVLDYLRRSIDAHLVLLSGERDPLEVYFPGGSTEAAEGIYRFNPFMHYLNGIAAAALARYVRAAAPSNTPEILEVGAGTGGTTASLLPALPKTGLRYTFTDLSDFFLDAARTRFADYPILDFGRYDINLHPAIQGVDPATKDVVVAVNVLHDARSVVEALRHLRLALRPGGLLLLVEATQNCALQMISIAFIEGLSDYEDDRVKTNLPFLSIEEWRNALATAGFVGIEAFPEHHQERIGLAQNVIIAYAPDHCDVPVESGLKAELTRSLPSYMIPRSFVLMDDLPLTANGKLDRARLPRFAERKEARAANTTLPSPGLEAEVAAVWSATLNRPQVYAEDHFFDLGGDSLLATRVVSDLGRRLGIDLSIRRLFEHPILSDFSAHIAASIEQREVTP